MKTRSPFAFSLVELTFALGVAAFCLIAVFGLMPVGMQTNRNASSQSAATNIVASVIADARDNIFDIPAIWHHVRNCDNIVFDAAGQFTTALGANSRYRVSISFPSSPSGLSYADVNITWPAAAAPTNASGSVEMFAAFDRN